MSHLRLLFPELGSPSSNYLHTPLLTDTYELTMMYAYWKRGMHEKKSAFEAFFRKCPFKGEYAVFAGLDTVLQFLNAFRFSESDIEYLRKIMPLAEDAFFDYLAQIDASCLKVTAMKEGTLCYPQEPLIRIEGPLAVAQVVETPILTIIGYATLVCTNARRMRQAAGPDKTLMEFGLRRAQGPDGGMSASIYAIMGGFDTTSNTLAGKEFDIPVSGTHAHSFVMSFKNLDEVASLKIQSKDGSKTVDFFPLVMEKREMLKKHGIQQDNANESELAAFISYASSFPNSFCALVDTYDTLRSGLVNFLSVAFALKSLGWEYGSIRLDSGDLAYLSRTARETFAQLAKELEDPSIEQIRIVASNDLNEDTIISLNSQGHEIDVFGIGTNLTTCQKQPSLGDVYKLVEISDEPRMKLSNDIGKTTIPSKKIIYRLYSETGTPILDLMVRDLDGHPDQVVPKVGQRILCRHPFEETKRCFVVPHRVEQLNSVVWEGKSLLHERRQASEIKGFVEEQCKIARPDTLRTLNPTPYKVSLDDNLYQFMHQLYQDNLPIAEFK
ncbi:putative Nicotinate phosphoribosyltransferase 1 [Blattamonas nauphoetae]|uniref:Nicotinate phosphoribosyltransferase n=1 Tax=Blattamonas nauphoetae TaxID=2049346 RepID=A0ABQ9Y9T5_9EUKA|nr:putative Nicotinate phosphoribosyltransferase 1 [Blattamonas nauphoetae]